MGVQAGEHERCRVVRHQRTPPQARFVNARVEGVSVVAHEVNELTVCVPVGCAETNDEGIPDDPAQSADQKSDNGPGHQHVHYFLETRCLHHIGGITSRRHLVRQRRLEHLNGGQAQQQKPSLLVDAECGTRLKMPMSRPRFTTLSKQNNRYLSRDATYHAQATTGPPTSTTISMTSV